MAVVPTITRSTPSPTASKSLIGIDPQKNYMNKTSVVVANTENSGTNSKRNVSRPKSSPSASESSTAERSNGNATDSQLRQRKYERKSKRFIWPEELHRLFVAAIFDVGLKNASPKTLLALMGSAGPVAGLTTEHLKSHLQKYRINYERSRQEFLQYYDQSVKRNLKRRRKNPKSDTTSMSIFPICPKRSKISEGSTGISDDSEEEDSDMEQSSVSESNVSQQQHHIAPRSVDGSMLHHKDTPKQHPSTANIYAPPSKPHAPHSIPPVSSMMGGRFGFMGNPMEYQTMLSNPAAAQYLRGVATNMILAPYGGQRKQVVVPNSNTLTQGNQRYPVGSANGSGTDNMVYDPQWSILSTFLSPHLSPMPGAPPNSVNTHSSASAAAAENMASSEPFALNEEPTDLQLQMHMAMQAQMNLHRQMLMRKVEVSQHIAGSGSSDSHGSFDQRWTEMENPSTQNNQSQQFASSHVPTGLLQNQQSSRFSSQDTSAVDRGNGVNLTTSKNSSSTPPSRASNESTLPSVATVSIANHESKTEEENPLDFYRWDRIDDLNVELEDEDLFGFLKS